MIFASFFISVLNIYFLNRKKLRIGNDASNYKEHKVSVIIPARNEELNIPKILNHLQNQSVRPFEVIVVDDNSSDRTSELADQFNGVEVLNLNEEPPGGWVGKSWAIWNGYKKSSGNILLFMDADVEPEENAIESLLNKYEKHKGMISVWPYQRFENLYEHLTLTFNLVVLNSSNMLGFPSKKPSGAFGPVVLTTREDYEQTGGHNSVKESVLEDIKLGKLYIENHIRVTNLIGNGIIKFRMYPDGFRQLFEGFTKNMSSGATSGGLLSFLLAVLWIAGFYASFTSFRFPIEYTLLRYFVFALITYLLSKPTGEYRWYDGIFYPVHFLFFVIVFFKSLYQTIFVKKVKWRGRDVDV
ncbi:MAG: glycosyltransferase [Kosmotogaceae bacterium]